MNDSPDQAGRPRAVPRWLVRATGPLTLLGLWWLVTATGWVGPETLPTPASVLDTAASLTRDG
ncbi:MAG: ABC transporter permease, partial [Actinomycetota bacterium]